MKYLILVSLISCATPPKGEHVMKKVIEDDRESKHKKNLAKKRIPYEKNFAKVFVYPQVLENHTLVGEGVIYLPVKKKENDWKSVWEASR